MNSSGGAGRVAGAMFRHQSPRLEDWLAQSLTFTMGTALVAYCIVTGWRSPIDVA